ncbi:MAG: peptidylprolyl isomerase [Ignavibacteria bacterium]|nr:peptidylprolyl isomerase [Ignavibacteria bacterium]
MASIQKGSLVTMHYTGTFADGEEFESSYGKEPLVFRVGNNEIIPGLELAVLGMEVGEKKDVAVPPELGYGEYRDSLVVEVQRAQLPDMEVELGDRLELDGENGENIIMTVIELNDETITLDANHDLAGEILNFAIEIVEVK